MRSGVPASDGGDNDVGCVCRALNDDNSMDVG
jgi:hypothetical protein